MVSIKDLIYYDIIEQIVIQIRNFSMSYIGDLNVSSAAAIVRNTVMEAATDGVREGGGVTYTGC